MKIKVLIADDHPIVRSGIRNELAQYEDIAIVGEAVNGNEVVNRALECRPHVVLLDIKMPGIKTVKILQALQRVARDIRVLILTAYGDPENVNGMMKAGARGYVLKNADPVDIVNGIREVAAGKVWVSPKVLEVLVEHIDNVQSRRGPDSLTARELEVIKHLGQGHSNHEMAIEMGVKERTVRFHLENIKMKLGVKNRMEVVMVAIQRDWISPPNHGEESTNKNQ